MTGRVGLAAAVVLVGCARLEPPRDERHRLIAAAGQQLIAHYVFPDVGQKMAVDLAKRDAQGDFDAAKTEADFARAVTEALRSVSHDPHAMLERQPAPGEADPEEEKWARIDAENRRTHGFGPTQWLPAKVALLPLNSFEPLEETQAVAAARLAEVASATALIIDLREDTGGDPRTVALVAGHLLGDAPVHLNDLWWREGAETQQFFTSPPPKETRFSGPVFVLTSHTTHSAAEELAYDLQALRRATIVGEATRGGAHPVAPTPLSPRFTLRIPAGRAINPITHTNWEGAGVQPDVVTAPAAALDAALRSLGGR